MKKTSTRSDPTRRQARKVICVAISLIPAVLVVLSGCRGASTRNGNANFFTSGSQQADQRASQRMAKAEQLNGSGEGAGEQDIQKAKVAQPGSNMNGTGPTGQTNQAAKAEGKLALFYRLGGDVGISNIVTDFVPRALNDPRVNWERKGVKQGGFSIHAGRSVTWNASPENVAMLNRHLIEFLGLATGGPAHYTGKEIQSAHADMHISNPEFDAVVGDLKVSLDRLQVPNLEQKDLLAIIESTRPEIVTER